MFTTALFTIARTWKKPRCPVRDEWTKKLWYTYTMEHCSAIRRNTFESTNEVDEPRAFYTGKLIQKEKYKYHILMYIMESKKMALMNLFSGQQWRNRDQRQRREIDQK